MAQKTITVLIDDLTGKELGSNGETVRFSLDGTNYEIDVDAKAAAKLRGVLDPYVRSGRRLVGSRGVPARRVSAGPSPAAVRAWAAANGIKVSDRGRIPASVVDQFLAAGN